MFSLSSFSKFFFGSDKELTPAHNAELNKHANILHSAAMVGLDLNQTDYGMASTYNLANRRHVEVFSPLSTSNSVRQNLPANTRAAPAHRTATTGNTLVLRSLTAIAGPDFNQQDDNYGMTLTYDAANRRHVEVFRSLSTSNSVAQNQPTNNRAAPVRRAAIGIDRTNNTRPPMYSLVNPTATTEDASPAYTLVDPIAVNTHTHQVQSTDENEAASTVDLFGNATSLFPQ